MIYRIDIVMVTWNRPDLTFKAIEAIHKNTDHDHYRLIVVDNGSEFEMVRQLRQRQDRGLIDTLILNETNLGLEPARNQGLASVDSDLFICADNDCLPQPRVDGKDWIELLVKLMKDNPDYAAISCRTQVMIGTGNIFEEADQNEDDIVEFPHPGGSLRIMQTSAVRKAGGWRDEVGGRGTEERYIGGRLHELGLKTGFAAKIKTLHLFGDRTKGTDRWGYPEDFRPEDTGHSDIWHPALANGDDPEEIKKYVVDNS